MQKRPWRPCVLAALRYVYFNAKPRTVPASERLGGTPHHSRMRIEVEIWKASGRIPPSAVTCDRIAGVARQQRADIRVRLWSRFCVPIGF